MSKHPRIPAHRRKFEALSILSLPLVLSLSCQPAIPLQHKALAPRPTSAPHKKAASAGAAGALGGKFSVNDSGEATYAIPILVPPGTGGMQPQLSLQYVSSQRHGLAGVGWGLAGLSTITRVGANIKQDGFCGGIDYGSNDRFALDDQRLIQVAEGGGTKTYYHTAIESWKRVEPSFADDRGQACGASPCWFSVIDRGGETYEYGRTSDSRILARGGSDVRVWALDRVTDLNGNAMTISYTATPYDGSSDEGQYYPASIHYTSNAGQKLAAQRSVEFGYEPRPDVQTHYIGGGAVVTRARLASVSTRLDGALVTRLALSYEPKPSPATAMSRLASVTECDGAGTLCLPPTRFTWQDATSAFSDSGSWLSNDFVANWDAKDPRYLGDVNGDGLTDIVGFRVDTQVSLATGSAFQKATSWSDKFGKGWTAATPRAIADVTGDGIADLVGFNFDGVLVAPSSGSKFDTGLWSTAAYPYFGKNAAAGGWVENKHPRLLVDVNGDGMADIVGFRDKTYVALSSGDHFAPPEVWNEGDFSGDWWQSDKRMRLLGDVNGDGVADVVGFDENRVVVGISTGNRTKRFDLGEWPQNGAEGYPYFGYDKGWRVDTTPIVLADVNGDGLADIVGFKDGAQVGLSTGKGFLAPQQWNDGFSAQSSPVWRADQPRTLMDVNGDSLADIVGFGAKGVVVALSTGAQFVAADWDEASLPDFVGGAQLMTSADVNGDGRADVITFGGKRGAPQTVNVGLSAGQYPDMLKGIANGLGGRYGVHYAPLTDKAIYTAGGAAAPPAKTRDARSSFTPPAPFVYSNVASSYPIVNAAGGSIYVVAAVDEDVGVDLLGSDKYVDRYTYTAARFDLLLNSWLGFESVARVRASDGRKTITSYNQAYPYTGTTSERTIACADVSLDSSCKPGAVLQREVYSYRATETAKGVGQVAPAVNQVLLDAERTERSTYGHYDHSIGTRYAYDAYGNATLVSYLGEVDQTGADLGADDNVYTCTSYLNDTSGASWKIGYSLKTKESSSAACDASGSFEPIKDFSLSTVEYDVAGGTMNVLRDGGWDDHAGKYLTHNYTYDEYGNQTSTKDPQGNVASTSYDAVYHTFVAASRSPALSGEGDRALSFTYQYDARFGAQVAEVDPNGNVAISCLDDLGRLSARQVSRPGGDAVADGNCLASGAGSDALVVTVQTREYRSTPKGGIYLDTTYLQDWDRGQGRSELHALRFYDGRGRVYERALQNDPAVGDVLECVAFDPYNRPARLSYPYFGSAADGCRDAATRPPWRKISYDVTGRIKQMTRRGGPTGAEVIATDFSYPDWSTAVVTQGAGTPEASASERHYGYFNGKRALTRLATGSDKAVSTFTYDRVGRLLVATDPTTKTSPKGVASTFTYDALDRKISEASPDRGSMTFNYGGTEWLQKTSDGDGARTFGYDELGRVVRESLPKGTVFLYSYDEVDAANGQGQITTSAVKEQGGALRTSYRYGYDALGNEASVTLSLDGGSYTSQYSRDPLGRVRRLVFPDGSVLEREYGYGNLRSLSLDKVKYLAFSGYTPFYEPQIAAFPTSGVTETMTVSPTGEPDHHTVQAANGQLYLDRTHSWNALRLARGFTDQLKSGGKDLSETYSYTNRRLTSAKGPYGTRSYAYDASGNLTAMDATSLTYEAHRPIAGKAGGKSVFEATYDAMGRMTTRVVPDGSYRFDYDDDGRLAGVSKDSASLESYRYDAEGRRLLSASAAGQKTLYVSEDYEIRKDVDGHVEAVRYLSADQGGPVAMVKLGATSPELTAIHRDHLGSTVLTTQGDGQIVGSYGYLVYGAPRAGDSGAAIPFKFTGNRLDDSTGLYYVASRYYDPLTGRFLSPDDRSSGGLSRQDALNLYAYALNAPSSMRDPSGRCPVVAGAEAVGVGAVEVTAVVAEATTTATSMEAAAVTTTSVESLAAPEGMLGSEAALDIADSAPSIADESMAGEAGVERSAGPRPMERASGRTRNPVTSSSRQIQARSGSYDHLLRKAQLRAQDRMRRYPLGKHPTMTTVAQDMPTGRRFYGKSKWWMRSDARRINKSLKQKFPEVWKERWPPINCAEVDACNTALDYGADLKNLNMVTVRTTTGEAVTRCRNCKKTTSIVRTLSDPPSRK